MQEITMEVIICLHGEIVASFYTDKILISESSMYKGSGCIRIRPQRYRDAHNKRMGYRCDYSVVKQDGISSPSRLREVIVISHIILHISFNGHKSCLANIDADCNMMFAPLISTIIFLQ